MKIKLALLDNNPVYLNRVVPMLNNRFANELEIYSFTDIEGALHCLDEKKIDVFLSSDSFKIDFNKIPKKCGFAYLVENLDIDSINNIKAVCKFQKGEIIYKQVLSIYSEHVPNITGLSSVENGAMKTIVFTSPCGGVGTTTAAVACSISLATKGYRVLYINGEVFGDSDMFFSCDGQFDFSDVIYAIKSNKTNRAMKLQSTVKQDVTGVYYYSSVKIALDMMEMHAEDYAVLQNELKALGDYDYVVMDMEFPKVQSEFKFFESCNSIVIVTDGSETTESKIEKALESVQILDSQSDISMLPRMCLLKNKMAVNDIAQHEIRTLGAVPMYQSVHPSQMARQISLSNLFDQLL